MMNRCPTCSNAMSFVPQYQQWYCYACQQYKVPAPQQPVQQQPQYSPQPVPQQPQHFHQPQSAQPQTFCPACNGPGTFVPAYNQYYCDRCRAYIPQQPSAPRSQPQQSYQQPQPTPQFHPQQPAAQPHFQGGAPHMAPQPGMSQPAQINIGIVTHALEKGTTLFDKSRNQICYLPDEQVRSIGTSSLERDMTQLNMTMFKGELFITQYRLVFVEKARFLDPSWMSFWFNVDFEGRTFQVEGAPGMCRGMFLEMEPKQLARSIDIRMRYVQMDNGLLPQAMLAHPVKLYKLDMFQMLTQARDVAPPLKASVLHDHLSRVTDPSGNFSFGLWDMALERAMKGR